MAFCTNCGIQGAGNFCANCGTQRTSIPSDVLIPIEPDGNLDNEVRYEVLLRYAEVRNRIDKCSRNSSKKMTGEEWLGLYDKAFKPLTGVSLQTVASIVAPIYAQIGIRTGKKRQAVLNEPTGRMIVMVLCALAESGMPISEVHQGEGGCVVEAKLPSDLLSLEGQLVISIERAGRGTRIEAATNIPGQWFDWGKSSRCLEKLFNYVGNRAA